MKIASKFLSLMALTGLLVFSSCGDDDDGGSTPEPTKDGIIESQDDADLDAADLKGSVTADIKLDAATEWTLTGPLAVKSGATLTIEAGTTIKAVAGGTNVYMVIETGAKIMAEGTATDPIKITSAASNPRSGDWGGLIVNGLAPISGGGTSTTEVLPLSYGGDAVEDNSGVIKYMILEYTGARINGEKEFNGFTFYAVGSGTIVENIAINYGDDDGIEFFGGRVNVKNILAVNIRDDMFDWTQGYQGTITNAYGIRQSGFTAESEDVRGLEGDGNLDGISPDQEGQSDVTFNGLTIINEDETTNFADLIKVRRGSSITITNGFVSDVATAEDFIDCTDKKGHAAGGTITVVGAGTVDIEDVQAGDNEVIVTATEGETGGVDAALFSWTSILN
ncbi:hypothetical protein LVD15_08595 [Fulvivirga maritima]|uniref:hypothetical protein n=1 Tax=Fulvivirga maritima TaxID=2904247 RepID=UPI001F21AA53|nr:hypothetical protein [Fulvivirga maritima]UII28473.1 hypothetical protein LVD15_08595 [Fulvivirga maritima]